ncbi:MAG: hypothetical protein J6V99_06390 [Neisseriaceae bacterium]|nr:hypothetical protein [Neisseriaceae bacterium]
MTDATNPFTFWQQFWQTATPQMAAFMPPTNLQEVEKKISELRNIEVWLNFNLQALRTQLTMLEQQRSFFASASSMQMPIDDEEEKQEEKPVTQRTTTRKTTRSKK